MSGTLEQNRTVLDEYWEQVRQRHIGADWERVDHFLKSKWPTDEPDGKLKNDITVTSTIATSSDSSVLLLALGDCTYMDTGDDPRPWFVTQHRIQENKALASDITAAWEDIEVPIDQREQVKTITKYVVYDLTNAQEPPQMTALTCDGEGNVSVRINKLQIRSEPRRDAPQNPAAQSTIKITLD
ncbi:PREDICTED: uncharacterized protein LOC107328986 isoform X1 [Acropora digitifera]|uniref:uncharacterized protein LOC107328986 isoform X1 n=1 Tax=Acropora digitifera TaxID=70779 RepID=UPI00077A6EEC|nr:PREDICTED: uncharacterized protein LOC107328986 isoform X1 [Acropora digitifera]